MRRCSLLGPLLWARRTAFSAKTQKDYLRYIKLIETKFGTMPISALGAVGRKIPVRGLRY
jgi:hypothetical protein